MDLTNSVGPVGSTSLMVENGNNEFGWSMTVFSRRLEEGARNHWMILNSQDELIVFCVFFFFYE